MWCSSGFSFETVTCYTVHNSLSSVINRHHLNHDLYVDDTHFFIYTAPDANSSLQQLRDCLLLHD